MAVITLPSSMRLGPGSGMGQLRFDLATRSDPTGAEQLRVFGPPRWVLRLRQPANLTVADAATWRALVLRLRGGVNHLAAPDPGHLAPRGTLRGSLTLSGSHAQGATALVLAGSTGTLLAGDMLGIGTGVGTSQLVMVVADGAHAGVTIEPPLRQTFASGTAVTWDRPVAYYRLGNEAAQWTYTKGRRTVQGMALDLVESWTA